MRYSLEDWINRHGSMVITSDEEFRIGQVIHGLREVSHHIDRFAVRAVTRIVNDDFIVERLATEAEYVAQMKKCDPAVRPDDFEKRDYYYVLKRLVV